MAFAAVAAAGSVAAFVAAVDWAAAFVVDLGSLEGTADCTAAVAAADTTAGVQADSLVAVACRVAGVGLELQAVQVWPIACPV